MIHSQRRMTTSMSCSIRKIVSPSFRRFSMTSRIWRARVGFTPATGSSRGTSFGFAMIARASSRSFFWPPERFFAYSSRRRVSPTIARTSSARRTISRSAFRMSKGRRTRSMRVSPGDGGAATIRFSSTVMFRSSLGIWKVLTRPRRTIAYGGSPSIRSPSNHTSPPSAAWSPAMTLKRLDFPAPFGPISPVIVWRRTDREHPSTARIPPNFFETSFTSRIVSAMGSVLRLWDVLFLRNDSLGAEEDEQHEKESNDDVVHVVQPEREDLRRGGHVHAGLLGAPTEEREHVRAQDDPARVAAAAEDDHDERVERQGRDEDVRHDVPQVRGLQGPREAHDRASQAEGGELEAERVLPEGLGRLLVLPHRP